MQSGSPGPTVKRDSPLSSHETVISLPGMFAQRLTVPRHRPLNPPRLLLHDGVNDGIKAEPRGPYLRPRVWPRLHFILFYSYSAWGAAVQRFVLRGGDGPGTMAPRLSPPSSLQPECPCCPAFCRRGCVTQPSRPDSEATTRAAAGPLGWQEALSQCRVSDTDLSSPWRQGLSNWCHSTDVLIGRHLQTEPGIASPAEASGRHTAV